MASEQTAERLVAALGNIYRAMRGSGHRWERLGLPVRRSDLIVMRYLAAQGEQRVTAIAEQMCVSASVVSRQLAALEVDGLLTRRADPDDARAGLVSLTEAGEAQLAEVTKIYARHLAPALVRWSTEDAEGAIAFIHDVADVIVDDAVAATPAAPA